MSELSVHQEYVGQLNSLGHLGLRKELILQGPKSLLFQAMLTIMHAMVHEQGRNPIVYRNSARPEGCKDASMGIVRDSKPQALLLTPSSLAIQATSPKCTIAPFAWHAESLHGDDACGKMEVTALKELHRCSLSLLVPEGTVGEGEGQRNTGRASDDVADGHRNEVVPDEG